MSIQLFLVVVLTLGILYKAFAAGSSTVIRNIQNPVSMIYDKQGNVFVTEWSANKVSTFNLQGKHSSIDKLFVTTYLLNYQRLLLRR